MPEDLEARMDRVERNLDRLTQVTLLIAELQKEAEERRRKSEQEEEERRKEAKERHEYLDQALRSLRRAIDESIRNRPRHATRRRVADA